MELSLIEIEGWLDSNATNQLPAANNVSKSQSGRSDTYLQRIVRPESFALTDNLVEFSPGQQYPGLFRCVIIEA